jgi:hypothetical protein
MWTSSKYDRRRVNSLAAAAAETGATAQVPGGIQAVLCRRAARSHAESVDICLQWWSALTCRCAEKSQQALGSCQRCPDCRLNELHFSITALEIVADWRQHVSEDLTAACIPCASFTIEPMFHPTLTLTVLCALLQSCDAGSVTLYPQWTTFPWTVISPSSLLLPRRCTNCLPKLSLSWLPALCEQRSLV